MRHTDRHAGPGTTPPVPGPPSVFLRALALPTVLLVIFALCAWQVAAHGPLLTLDERLGRAIAGSPLPSPVAEFLADLGNTAVALPVLGVALACAAWRSPAAARRWPGPLAATLAMAAVPALVAPLKALIDRPGPPGPLADETGFFPSGHAATAAVAYGAAAVLLLPLLRGGLRGWLIGVVVLLNLAVGVGLVRRAYHWPLDVAGSWCLCGCLLWAVLRVRQQTG
ncbi:phosphatase PAP2 family protein [Streptomyces sp. NBRC 110028]|uniref:phosphatase PAP2 family protein n=1 Tax=Streptomyces sp. NBRC 110028 TaxID=1621260 RepID=UPI0006E1B739|nr:phosphatase PAP2 family protein [Streptomyces sp. NBRC 110028]